MTSFSSIICDHCKYQTCIDTYTDNGKKGNNTWVIKKHTQHNVAPDVILHSHSAMWSQLTHIHHATSLSQHLQHQDLWPFYTSTAITQGHLLVTGTQRAHYKAREGQWFGNGGVRAWIIKGTKEVSKDYFILYPLFKCPIVLWELHFKKDVYSNFNRI